MLSNHVLFSSCAWYASALRMLVTPSVDMRQWEMDRALLVSDEQSDMYAEEFVFHENDGSAKELTHNLCIDGHVVPEFFLLGAMKTSTTTLAANLHTSAGIYFPGDNKMKELHFFDQKVTLNDKQSWLNYYPKCSFEQRIVATDCTPSYIRTNGTAKRISDFYGDIRSKIKFALMLREPLGRAQSAFYHLKSNPGRIPTTLTFNDLVKMHIQDGFDTREIMWGSQYPQQLQEYFEEFDSAQFMIVPFRCNIDFNLCGLTKSFTEILWSELGVPPGAYDQHLHKNIHEHPELDQDLDSEVLQKATEKFRSIADDMARLLASSNAKLFGYTGTAGDQEAIKTWLTKGW